MNAFWMALIALCLSTTAHGGAGTTHGTAAVLSDKEWEVGLYAPLRRGMGNGVELSIHPLVAILSPHLATSG